jgi:5'-3' exonuclease
VQAPGEAKAELAALNTQKVTDAVVSEDVDVLVFGAKCVIRM